MRYAARISAQLAYPINVFPAKRAPPLGEHPFFYVVFITFPALFMDNLTYEARLGLAMEDIGKQAMPNWLGTARRFQIDRETLKRRFNGSQQSIRLARSETHQCLSIVQEETLIGYIIAYPTVVFHRPTRSSGISLKS